MSAKRLICAVNSSSKAGYKIIDLPSLFLVLPELVWLRRIRRVLFQNDFFCKKKKKKKKKNYNFFSVFLKKKFS